MESRGRKDQVKMPRFHRPLLKCDILEAHLGVSAQVFSRDGKKVRADIQAQNRVAQARQRQGRLPGTAANLKRRPTLGDAGEADNIREHLVRVAWANAVIFICRAVESGSEGV